MLGSGRASQSAGSLWQAKMSDPTTPRTRMPRLAVASLRPRALVCLRAHVAPCVLDLLGQARPRAHAAVESII
jgi:hypothetical protein